MKRFIVITLLLVSIAGMTACVSVEKQAKIDSLVSELQVKTKELNDAYKKFKDGTLTSEEFKGLTSDIQETISKTNEEVIKLRDDGVGWAEMVGATLLGVISRGIPSKGPLALLQNLFSARRKEE